MDNIPPDSTYGPYPVMPLLIHGDAAFAGQGVVAETFNLSLIRGYRVGGTIHLVINNQLGFTTTPDAARSTQYSTDVAKMVGAPIFHVNGDDPEACVRAARLAFAYRQRFNKDAVIDMICYRRHGHNEGDDPSYTLPEMYRRINAKPTVRTQYRESLLKRGDISAEDADASLAEFRDQLQAALDETRDAAPGHNIRARRPPEPMGVMPHVRTAIDSVTVERIYEALNTVPEGFTVHPKLARQFEQRNKVFRSGEFDWGVGEAMAFGSLLMEGTPVRLSGQDSRRGTFSHRHSTLVDYVTGDEYVPLSTVCAREADLWIYDSLLSEYAALGFEYGYAVAKPEALVMWEAQFGDFANGAQIIIDQFIVAAEDKWDQHCGIVLLLPHGMEGQGPEHSSARIERFLTLAAEDNMHVCQPTTAGQYFHLLRRQMIHRVRKPMILFTPKSLLRAKAARSKVADLSSGTFEEVLGDPGAEAGTVDAEAVTRVVFCSGKVAYAAMELRDEHTGPAGRVPGRAALPVAVRGGRLRASPVPQRLRDRLAAGGAREHGRLERHQGTPLRGPRRRLRDPEGEPPRVGQPCGRQPNRARPGTAGPARRGCAGLTPTADDHRLAAQLAHRAGELLVELRARLVDEEAPAAVLRAEGDRRAHELLVSELAAARPADAVLSEEGADDASRLGAERVWVIDPLDGTREFSEPGRTDWAVHVALVVDERPVAGAVSPARSGADPLDRRSSPAAPRTGRPTPDGRVALTAPGAGRRGGRRAGRRRRAAGIGRCQVDGRGSGHRRRLRPCRRPVRMGLVRAGGRGEGRRLLRQPARRFPTSLQPARRLPARPGGLPPRTGRSGTRRPTQRMSGDRPSMVTGRAGRVAR